VQTEEHRVMGGRNAVFSCPPIKDQIPLIGGTSVFGHRDRGDAKRRGTTGDGLAR
jgi:hypothetical protein